MKRNKNEAGAAGKAPGVARKVSVVDGYEIKTGVVVPVGSKLKRVLFLVELIAEHTSRTITENHGWIDWSFYSEEKADTNVELDFLALNPPKTPTRSFHGSVKRSMLSWSISVDTMHERRREKVSPSV